MNHVKESCAVGLLFVTMACAGLIAHAQAAPQQLSARIEGSALVIHAGDALFTAYKFSGDQKYPYFWPVNGPESGKSITTESSEPYPHHHSLFFGCDKVNGGNYWQEGNDRGQIVSEGPEIIEASGDRVAFQDHCLWRIPGQDPILDDVRKVRVSAPSASLRLIDFEITLKALVDVHIEKSNHALFSARVAPELCVQSGGVLRNAEGNAGEEATFGIASPWMDYTGIRDGVAEGIAILQHPDNEEYPFPWFTRDYGFFSPTPMNWLDESGLTLTKGEEVTLRYRVVVHAGDAEAAGIAGQFDAYSHQALQSE